MIHTQTKLVSLNKLSTQLSTFQMYTPNVYMATWFSRSSPLYDWSWIKIYFRMYLVKVLIFLPLTTSNNIRSPHKTTEYVVPRAQDEVHAKFCFWSSPHITIGFLYSLRCKNLPRCTYRPTTNYHIVRCIRQLLSSIRHQLLKKKNRKKNYLKKNYPRYHITIRIKPQ